jgi:hypothetical protein
MPPRTLSPAALWGDPFDEIFSSNTYVQPL